MALSPLSIHGLKQTRRRCRHDLGPDLPSQAIQRVIFFGRHPRFGGHREVLEWFESVPEIYHRQYFTFDEA